MNNRNHKLYIILLLFFSYFIAHSQDEAVTDIITGKASVEFDRYNPDEEFSIDITINIKEGWYTYDMVDRFNDEGIGPSPTLIFAPDDSKYELLDDIQTSKVTIEYDEGFEMEVGKFKKYATFNIKAKALESVDFNAGNEIGLYIQVCKDGKCLIPSDVFFTIIPIEKRDPSELIKSSSENVTLPDDIADMPSTSEETQVLSQAESDIENAKAEGAWSYFFLAMSFGALALLTPCVFPMIPITVSFFTKRSENENSSPVLDAVLFALGIICTFVAIGLITAAFFGAGAVGDIATNPWINIAIASVFLIFAFNLFGSFEIQIPTSILNKLNAKANKGGRGGLMLMGLVFSLTSFTCTVPFVGTSLIGTAKGEWFLPVIGMLGFSLVFAIPFFFLALFPTLLKKMPKSGGWMNNLKVVMGFVEIAAALKFISNVDLVWAWELLSRPTFVAIWIAIAILITLYILGVFLMKLDSPIDRLSGIRIFFAICFLSVAVALVPGLWNEPLGEIDAFLPPRDYMNAGTSFNGFGNSGQSDLAIWHKTLDDALESAKKTNTNIFIDFTGWTCTNCRLMEANMFPRPAIKSKMDKYVKAKLYTDRRKEPELTNKSLMEEKFGSIALPLYVLMTPEGTVIDKIEFTRDEDEFENFLAQGL